ncbi:MAG: hypothetical protein FI729_01320 [SAR202 cluster bacterium]|nr:hypothetical protein [SAR202 cluster bacterium]|tara:strand:+ start:92 stop:1072 length:981 start_codon:yes stop_codon:yes gene_type:complete
MSFFSPLKGFKNINSSTLSNDIQDGLVEFFDWALLDKGNYFNVTLNEQSPNGEDYSKLRLSSNDSYTLGQVWEGFRKNWVWQTGISVDGMDSPFVSSDANHLGVSGVYVNDVFQPSSGVGQYAHSIDHFNGRVIFDSAIPSGSKVQAEHSYKYINVVYANNVPWLREIQTSTLQPTSNFNEVSNGAWDIPTETRLQLPAIAIEVVPTRRFKGYQLGGGQFVYSDVIFHCIAEDEYTRNQMVDIISLQNDKTIHLFDSNSINQDSDFPLDYKGSVVPSALRYPDLVETHPGGRLRLTNARIEQMIMAKSDVFGGVVRMTTEGIKANI